jgi:serine protease Do
VNGAQHIQVTLHDQRTYEAEVVGSDPRTDIAVLRIQTKTPLPAAKFGESSTVKIGHWVVAVGHPFDFSFTVTAGIVSALGRRNLGQNEIQDYIQTDVAVNPGSSGGPLFNTDGEVIGINTAIYTPDKENSASAGISFAIPSEMAARIALQLLENGQVTYAGLGVRTHDAPATSSDPRPGAKVVQIRAGGPAEKAGLRRGDVIIAIDNEPIADSTSFQALVLSQPVGVDLDITFERGKRTKHAVARTVDEATLGSLGSTGGPDARTWAGAEIVEATSSRLTARGIALPAELGPGALVTRVKPDSPAALAGILPGDVLLQVQEVPTHSVPEFMGAVRDRNVALIAFWRGENRYLAAVATGGGQDTDSTTGGHQ